jgi:hypothetical protein
MKTAEQLKTLTIADAAQEFGWPAAAIYSMVAIGEKIRSDLPLRQENISEDEIEDWGRRDRMNRTIRRNDNLVFAQKITLGDVCQALNKEFEESGSRWGIPSLRNDRTTIRRLESVGLTGVDCIAIPKRTVTFEILANLPREELLGLDAALLGTLSLAELRRLSEVWVDDSGKNLGRTPDWSTVENQFRYKSISGPRLKVSELLAMKRNFICGKGVARTVLLFERLGFGPKDGPFMSSSDDPRKKMIKVLITEEGLTLQEAIKFVEIAAKRNWI